jgi:SP family sugar:H+ symporter-like MFS transporter
MSTQTNRRVIVLAIAGALGGFLFGFDSSVINGALDAIKSEFALSDALTGFTVAIALLGCAVGAFLAGRFADRFGRIPVMIAGATLFVVSSLGSGFSTEVLVLIIFRVIGGLGIGIASVVAPTYISEISPSAIRGRLGSLQQLAITLGIFIALLTDAVFANTAGSESNTLWFGLEAWRWMFLAGIVPGLVYGIVSSRLPESPRYLLLKGNETRARQVLEEIQSGPEVDAELTRIQSAIAEDEKNKTSTLRGPALGLKPIVWIGIALSVFQQFVGINVIFYYSTELWAAVGFTQSNSLIISVVTGVVNILVTLIAIALVDRIGRRPILMTGSIGMAVSLGVMALAFAQGPAGHLEGAWGPIALVAANLFVVCFGASWGPLVWVLLGEIFPNTIRAKALGLAAAAQWIANFLITVSFPSLSGFSLPLTYGAYALFAALSFFFIWRLVPETKGMALEDADKLLDRAK